MACRGCRQYLSQSARQRQGVWNLIESQSGTVPARQLSGQTIAVASHPQQQRRSFRTTSQCQKSWMPEPVRKLAAALLQSTAEPYQVHAATETIYKSCARQAAYTISETDKRNGTVKMAEDGVEMGTGDTMWHKELNLPPTFSTWSQVTMLHMYLIFVRLRNLPKDSAKSWQKQLVDHFFFDAEDRMDRVHGIASRGLRHRYLKDLFIQWRGITIAYDEGVVKGDAVLAAALWRNIYKGREDVDMRHLAAVTSWIRANLKSLDGVPDEALFFSTVGTFKWPVKNELALVDKPARELDGVLPAAPAARATPLEKTSPLPDAPRVFSKVAV
ncbi:ubiquinol-cytochrome C chaperone-domain-containing protein [Xylariales sp. AK1849]|nr:ubiquinol-cytochrome C chaperone-domain-containing protein [Xylariales sp. AK1849]